MQRELLFSASHDPGEVFAALSARYSVLADSATSERWVCLDTADWRLHRAGLALRDRQRGSRGELVLSADGRQIAAPSRAANWPRRVDRLAPSAVRDRVAAAAGVRALLPMAAVDSRAMRLRLLDDAQKTRVRVDVEQQRLSGPPRAPLPLRVVLSPLRGYERDALRCAELLTTSMAVLDAPSSDITAALAAAGLRPGVAGRPAAPVDPCAPAAHTVAVLLGEHLDVIDASRHGVLDDVDIEFLHDMRTAIRASRSLLSLAGDVLPGPTPERIAAELAWLGRLTAPVRDLDVLLPLLAAEPGADELLAPLRLYLSRRRASALRRLRTGLRSERGVALSRSWRAALDSIVAADLPGPDTATVAAERAGRAYRRVRREAGPVTMATPADDLHRLRKRCKRLRYLLEGFAPALDPDAGRLLLAPTKKLLDCLGEVQDCDVQHRALSAAAAHLASRGGPVETLLATGVVRDRVTVRGAQARQQLPERIERLCGPTARRDARDLALRTR